ncbi:esterase B1-like [Armigeres subalbatus]|uniref:esterase B1-like n=1 Tax=Armigeres subalbatus TaxID=124917 RepID=UPI002ED19737
MRILLLLSFIALVQPEITFGLDSESCDVKFQNGSYGEGTLNQTFTGVPFCTYLGVRYAEAPVGQLRFRNPILHHPHGAEKYTEMGNMCPQENDIYNFTEILGDEDCLFMNIYAPRIPDSNKYPVVVYVHGGTFMVGSSQENVGNGVDLLINSGVVVVSVNYRLSVLGFLRYPAFNITGNFGLKDQRAALQWVQLYIKYFGGDPHRVTLMGQSAGAGSVTYHLYSEGSRNLFQRLIALGGSLLAPWALNYNSLEDGEKLIAHYNISSLVDLQQLHFKEFLERTDSFDIFGFFSMFYPGFIPSVEDHNDPEAVITATPHELIRQKPVIQVPILIGHTSTEFELLLYYASFLYVGDNFPNKEDASLKRNITKLIKHKFKQANDPNFYRKLANVANLLYPIKRLLQHLFHQLDSVPLYYLQFEFDGRFGFYKNHFYAKRTEGSRYGAVHGDDLGYIFSPYVVQEALLNRSEFRREWKVHERTVELVTNFVKYGDPTPKRSKLSHVWWPPFNGNSTEPKQHLHIGESFEIREDDDAANEYIQLWEPIYQCLYYYDCDALMVMVEQVAESESEGNLLVDVIDESMNLIENEGR